jgi:hypothetical protein
VLGFAVTIWLVFRAKTAAEQARDAAQQVRARISALDTIGELSAAITILNEILRLQRTNHWETVWDIVLDRYANVRRHLVRSEQGAGVGEVHQNSIRTAVAQLSIIVEEIEQARTHQQQDQLETVRFNRIISNQIDAIERALVDVKKAGV